MEKVKQPYSLFARTQKLWVVLFSSVIVIVLVLVLDLDLCLRGAPQIKGWSLRLRLLSSSIFDLCLRGAPQMQRLEPSLTPSLVLDL